jgi:SAM-dependent methyltransferase
MMLRPRDVDHFLYLRRIGLDIARENPVNALNFGSGHGGMSYLLVAAGFEVTNVDLFDAGVPEAVHVQSLNEVERTFALIYASHSIEHVTDIRKTMHQIISRLEPGGYLFVEVPNSEYPAYVEGSGSDRKPRLHPPHTQYITREFFATLPLATVALETICYEGSEAGRPVTNASEGEVIRYVGRKS